MSDSVSAGEETHDVEFDGLCRGKIYDLEFLGFCEGEGCKVADELRYAMLGLLRRRLVVCGEVLDCLGCTSRVDR